MLVSLGRIAALATPLLPTSHIVTPASSRLTPALSHHGTNWPLVTATGAIYLVVDTVVSARIPRSPSPASSSAASLPPPSAAGSHCSKHLYVSSLTFLSQHSRILKFFQIHEEADEHEPKAPSTPATLSELRSTLLPQTATMSKQHSTLSKESFNL